MTSYGLRDMYAGKAVWAWITWHILRTIRLFTSFLTFAFLLPGRNVLVQSPKNHLLWICWYNRLDHGDMVQKLITASPRADLPREPLSNFTDFALKRDDISLSSCFASSKNITWWNVACSVFELRRSTSVIKNKEPNFPNHNFMNN